MVENVKGGNICGTCTYVHRGSFSTLKMNDFIEKKEQVPSFEEKPPDLNLVVCGFLHSYGTSVFVVFFSVVYTYHYI